MDNLLKNVITILILCSVAAFGYYLYAQKDSFVLDQSLSTTNPALVRAQDFIQYRTQLSQVTIDTKIFDDPNFRTLESYRVNLQQAPVGRSNPFDITSGQASRLSNQF